jgi:hypothetical protein
MIGIRRLALPAWYALALLLAGCMADRSSQIPANARLASEGTGQVTYRAADDGKVYVFDQNDNKIIYSGDIQKGQIVTVDPQANRVMIGDNVVSERSLHAGNSHRIFVDTSTEAQPAKHTVIEERRESSVR